MTDSLINSLVTIATAIVGVAILAVLVSKNSQTSTVLDSAGSAFARALNAATAPVTGSGMGIGAGSFYSPSLGGGSF